VIVLITFTAFILSVLFAPGRGLIARTCARARQAALVQT
jgi:hypothetical protein